MLQKPEEEVLNYFVNEVVEFCTEWDRVVREFRAMEPGVEKQNVARLLTGTLESLRANTQNAVR